MHLCSGVGAGPAHLVAPGSSRVGVARPLESTVPASGGGGVDGDGAGLLEPHAATTTTSTNRIRRVCHHAAVACDASTMLDDKQKRAFIALACKVAWADGVVADEERAQVAALLQRFGGAPVTPEELDAWLSSGAPAAELADLPPAMSEMFIYEAWQLVESDGDVSDTEIKLIEGLLGRVAKAEGEGTKLGQIKLVKKSGWRPA